MHFPISKAAISVALLQVAAAYNDNCKGSGVYMRPWLGDCLRGINNINSGASYSDQAQFSSGHCYIIYATNGAGAQPVSGQTLINTANRILNNCSGQNYVGSYGTGTCDKCHVTVNFRA